MGHDYIIWCQNRFGFRDPIARGLATAGSAHGLGTAALARKCASPFANPSQYEGFQLDFSILLMIIFYCECMQQLGSHACVILLAC